jgi:hypothetical protein
MCKSLIVLSSGESDVDPWSSESEELLSPFARMAQVPAPGLRRQILVTMEMAHR